MARASGENFPVALRLLPRAVRHHLRAIYGYARLVDNLGDEYPGDRHAALDWVEDQLDSLFAGTPRHEAFVQLAPTVQRFGLAREPFDQLLAANRLDQHKSRYEDFDELLGYCKLSANPVGHLVLAVFEASTPERVAASDDVCGGLQVLEHLQDVAEDAAMGRVYLPVEDMAHFGVAATTTCEPPLPRRTSEDWSPTRPAGLVPCSTGADRWWLHCVDRPAWPWPGSWPEGSPTSTRSGPPASTCWAGPPRPARPGCWAGWPACTARA